MKEAMCLDRPEVEMGVENPERQTLRSEVTELLCSARAMAAADLSAVRRGCRHAALLQRAESIRARNGLPPNPVRTRTPERSRARQVLDAQARERDMVRGRRRGRTCGAATAKSDRAFNREPWQFPRQVAAQVIRMFGGR